jgi:hypothetical protein
MFNPGQENLDLDGQGDACDNDIDGDGCANNVDQDPINNQHRIGTALDPACPERTSPYYGFSGIDLNILDSEPPYCQDLDDDNDGIPDWGPDGIPGNADDDPCPIGPLPGSISGECAIFKPGCPGTPKNWWEICFGGGCVEYFAKFEYAINPDPVTTTYVDQIRIVNEALDLVPSAGTSVSSLAQKIAQVGPQSAFDGQGGGAPINRVRVEIWARATGTEPAHLVAVVGEYDPAQIGIGQLELGRMLAFNFTRDETPTLQATWNPGAESVDPGQDSDNDGLPDGWEILHGLDPRNPDDALLDTDGDGAGNGAEFQAGTDPRDPASVFRVLRIRRLATEVRVDFAGTSARRFQLARSTQLDHPDWNPVGAARRGHGGEMTLIDPDPHTGQQAFYRIDSYPD